MSPTLHGNTFGEENIFNHKSFCDFIFLNEWIDPLYFFLLPPTLTTQLPAEHPHPRPCPSPHRPSEDAEDRWELVLCL